MEYRRFEMFMRRGILTLNLIALAFMSAGSIQREVHATPGSNSAISSPAGIDEGSIPTTRPFPCVKRGTGMLCREITPPPGWEEVK